MDSEFETIGADYVKKMKKHIKDRFKKRDMHVFDYFSKVLEPETLNSVFKSESEEEVTHLAAYYGHEKKVKIVQGNLTEGIIEQETAIAPLLDLTKLKQ